MRSTPYVYCICRLDKKYFKGLNRDLQSRGYKKIKAIVPSIRLLRSTKKGKNNFTEVPLLFNFGFIRMKSDKAFDRNFLNKLRREIPGIHGWVRSLDYMHPKKKKLRIDNAEDWDDFSIVATVTRDQVRYYKRIAKQNRIYSMEDAASIQIGSFLSLRGYPFDGLDARVEDFNLTTKIVTLTLFPEKGGIVIRVPMDNVLYSIYEDYDEDRMDSYNEYDFSGMSSEEDPRITHFEEEEIPF